MDDAMPQQDEQTPPDMSNGYCVKFYVYGDGSYGVGDPQPIEEGDEESQDKADDDNHIPDLTRSLKMLLNVVKSNPVGSDDEAAFNAGFDSGPSKGSPYA